MLIVLKPSVDARMTTALYHWHVPNAFSVEGMESAIERRHRCVDAGAEHDFPESH